MIEYRQDIHSLKINVKARKSLVNYVTMNESKASTDTSFDFVRNLLSKHERRCDSEIIGFKDAWHSSSIFTLKCTK